MIIKKMQKSGRKTPRFSLKFRAKPMDKRLVRGWDGKSVNWEVAKHKIHFFFFNPLRCRWYDMMR